MWYLWISHIKRMDTDSLEQVTQALTTLTKFDWTPLMWVIGILGGVFTALLSVIVYFLKVGKEESNDAIKDFREAWNKHDDRLNKQQEEIHKIALNSARQIAVIERTLEMVMDKKRKR
jgi:membrane protein required for beta-lactamase induction